MKYYEIKRVLKFSNTLISCGAYSLLYYPRFNYYLLEDYLLFKEESLRWYKHNRSETLLFYSLRRKYGLEEDRDFLAPLNDLSIYFFKDFGSKKIELKIYTPEEYKERLRNI